MQFSHKESIMKKERKTLSPEQLKAVNGGNTYTYVGPIFTPPVFTPPSPVIPIVIAHW